jgi:hypothetical protein
MVIPAVCSFNVTTFRIVGVTPPEFLEASIRLLVAIESFLPTYEESFLLPNVFD